MGGGQEAPGSFPPPSCPTVRPHPWLELAAPGLGTRGTGAGNGDRNPFLAQCPPLLHLICWPRDGDCLAAPGEPGLGLEAGGKGRGRWHFSPSCSLTRRPGLGPGRPRCESQLCRGLSCDLGWPAASSSSASVTQTRCRCKLTREPAVNTAPRVLVLDWGGSLFPKASLRWRCCCRGNRLPKPRPPLSFEIPTSGRAFLFASPVPPPCRLTAVSCAGTRPAFPVALAGVGTSWGCLDLPVPGERAARAASSSFLLLLFLLAFTFSLFHFCRCPLSACGLVLLSPP